MKWKMVLFIGMLTILFQCQIEMYPLMIICLFEVQKGTGDKCRNIYLIKNKSHHTKNTDWFVGLNGIFKIREKVWILGLFGNALQTPYIMDSGARETRGARGAFLNDRGGGIRNWASPPPQFETCPFIHASWKLLDSTKIVWSFLFLGLYLIWSNISTQRQSFFEPKKGGIAVTFNLPIQFLGRGGPLITLLNCCPSAFCCKQLFIYFHFLMSGNG